MLQSQKISQLFLDLLGFIPGASESQKEVIRVADIAETSIARIFGIVACGSPKSLAKGDQSFLVGLSSLEIGDPIGDPLVFRVNPSPSPSGIFRDERSFDVLVEPVQVDIRELGTDDPALRRAAQRRSVVPAFEVSGLEQVLNQDQEAVVVDLLAED